MPIRTVSNTGGNWNATSSWVGGVVPIAGDDIRFTSTSGPLVVNVSTANMTTVDMSNYTNVMTINSGSFLNIQNASTPATYSAGTGGYTISSYPNGGWLRATGGGNSTIASTFSNVPIPAFYRTSGGTITFQGFNGLIIFESLDLGGSTVVSGSIASNTTFTNGTVRVLKRFGGNISSVGHANFQKLELGSGPNDTIIVNELSAAGGSYLMNNTSTAPFTMSVNCGTISGLLTVAGINTANTNRATLEILSGNTSNFTFNFVSTGTPTTGLGLTVKPDIPTNMTFNLRFNASSSNPRGLTLLNNFTLDNLNFIQGTSLTTTAASTLQILGTYSITAKSILLRKFTADQAPILQLPSGSSHTTGVLTMMGYGNETTAGRPSIISSTASSAASLSVTATASVMYANFTDINASSGNFSTMQTTLTRTTGISTDTNPIFEVTNISLQ